MRDPLDGDGIDPVALVRAVGHDLLNPLTGITFSAATLQRGGRLAEQDARAAARISRGAARAELMIRLFVELTRLRLDSTFALERVPVDMHALCRSVSGTLADWFPSARIETDLSGDGHGDWDADRLASALIGLGCAVLDHASGPTNLRIGAGGDAGGVTIAIAGPAPVAPAEAVSFDLLIARPGAPRPRLNLFRHFAARIVAAHGGSIEGDRAGAFRIALPRVRAEARSTAIPASAPNERRVAAGARTVLVVDDDDDLCRGIEPALAAAGYRALRAGTVAEAERLISAAPPDALLLDEQLGDGSGLDLLDRLRRDTTTRALPIILTSARDGAPGVRAVSWLRKPFSEAALLDALARVLA